MLQNLKALSIFCVYVMYTYVVYIGACMYMCTCLHAEARGGHVSISSLLPISFVPGYPTESGAGLVASDHAILWSPTSRELGLRACM